VIKRISLGNSQNFRHRIHGEQDLIPATARAPTQKPPAGNPDNFRDPAPLDPERLDLEQQPNLWLQRCAK